MELKNLSLQHFRCFSSYEMPLSSELTLVQGENGTGKTALLEAILMAGLGRSCRGAAFSALQQAQQEHGFQITLDFRPAAHLEVQRLSIAQKKRPCQLEFQLFNQKIPKLSVISTFPMQYLSANTFDWIESSPLYRRRLIDWGCFFLFPLFSEAVLRCSQLLKQRNALLKQSKSQATLKKDGQLAAFTAAFTQVASQVEGYRQSYVALLVQEFQQTIRHFLPQYPNWALTYHSGWRQDKTLSQALEDSFERDCYLGCTQVGPHRADLHFLVSGLPAKTYLSRGQTKLLLCALLSARASLLYRLKERRSVFMVDDLAAELDSKAQRRLFNGLDARAVQWIVSQIEQPDPQVFKQKAWSLVAL